MSGRTPQGLSYGNPSRLLFLVIRQPQWDYLLPKPRPYMIALCIDPHRISFSDLRYIRFHFLGRARGNAAGHCCLSAIHGALVCGQKWPKLRATLIFSLLLACASALLQSTALLRRLSQNCDQTSVRTTTCALVITTCALAPMQSTELGRLELDALDGEEAQRIGVGRAAGCQPLCPATFLQAYLESRP